MFKKIISVILAAALSFSLAACSDSKVGENFSSDSSNSTEQLPFPVTVTDQLGRTVTIEEEPERLVSGYYISTSLLIALGKEDSLVGIEAKAKSRPIYSLAAERLLTLPNVGTAKEFDLEGCIALDPDLVILPAKLKGTIPALEELGIKVIAVKPENEELMAETVELIGKAVGASDTADALKAFGEQLSDEISAAIKNTEKPTVYLSSNSSFLSAAGANMYQNTLIETAGGKNVAASLDGNSWSDIDYEQLLAWNPDVIVIAADADYTVDDVLNDTNISEITAVKEKRVYQFPSQFEAWDSPVPSGILGAAWLAYALHPENYSYESLFSAVTELYEAFYGFTPDPYLAV